MIYLLRTHKLTSESDKFCFSVTLPVRGQLYASFTINSIAVRARGEGISSPGQGARPFLRICTESLYQDWIRYVATDYTRP